RRGHRRLVSDWSSDVCSSDLGSLISPAGRCGVVVVAGGACGAGSAGVVACANADRWLEKNVNAMVRAANRATRRADDRQNIPSPPIAAFRDGKRGTRQNSTTGTSRITAQFRGCDSRVVSADRLDRQRDVETGLRWQSAARVSARKDATPVENHRHSHPRYFRGAMTQILIADDHEVVRQGV